MNFSESIDLQAERLASSGEAVADALRRIDIAPMRGGSVGFVGIGGSLYAAIAGATAFRDRGLRACALTPTDLMEQPSGLADMFVALSASGRSAEMVEAMRAAAGSHYAISKDDDNALAAVVHAVIPTRSALDSSPSAPSFTTTLLAIGLLADRLADRRTPGWDALPDAAAKVIASASAIVGRCNAAFARAGSLDFVGEQRFLGIALEGALLAREVARLPASGFELRNYLHGPMEALDVGMGLVVHGSGRAIRLARDAAALGCPTLLVTDQDDVPGMEHLTMLHIPGTGDALADGILQIIGIQRLVAGLSAARGLTDASFRYRQADTKLSASTPQVTE